MLQVLGSDLGAQRQKSPGSNWPPSDPRLRNHKITGGQINIVGTKAWLARMKILRREAWLLSISKWHSVENIAALPTSCTLQVVLIKKTTSVTMAVSFLIGLSFPLQMIISYGATSVLDVLYIICMAWKLFSKWHNGVENITALPSIYTLQVVLVLIKKTAIVTMVAWLSIGLWVPL